MVPGLAALQHARHQTSCRSPPLRGCWRGVLASLIGIHSLAADNKELTELFEGRLTESWMMAEAAADRGRRRRTTTTEERGATRWGDERQRRHLQHRERPTDRRQHRDSLVVDVSHHIGGGSLAFSQRTASDNAFSYLLRRHLHRIIASLHRCYLKQRATEFACAPLTR